MLCLHGSCAGDFSGFHSTDYCEHVSGDWGYDSSPYSAAILPFEALAKSRGSHGLRLEITCICFSHYSPVHEWISLTVFIMLDCIKYIPDSDLTNIIDIIIEICGIGLSIA